jgi:hypothetical protein
VLARRGLHVRVLGRRRRAVIKPCHGERESTDRAASKAVPERIQWSSPQAATWLRRVNGPNGSAQRGSPNCDKAVVDLPAPAEEKSDSERSDKRAQSAEAHRPTNASGAKGSSVEQRRQRDETGARNSKKEAGEPQGDCARASHFLSIGVTPSATIWEREHLNELRKRL